MKLKIQAIIICATICSSHASGIWVQSELQDTSIRAEKRIEAVSVGKFIKKTKSKDHVILPYDGYMETPSGNSKLTLVTTFYEYFSNNDSSGRILNIGEVKGLSSIQFIVDGKVVATRPIGSYENGRKSIYTPLSKVIGDSIKSGSVVVIKIIAGDSAVLSNGGSAYFRYYVSSEPYGKKNLPGFWIPTGIFSSNLNLTDSGMIFSSMPIGIAWGRKWYSDEGSYWGTSVCFNWSVYSNGSKKNSDYKLASFAPGILFDYNNYISFGAVYQLDFTNIKASPGPALIIGIGPDLMNLFK